MLSLMNNDINNIPLKWTKNKTTEDILYEHLSEEYLKNKYKFRKIYNRDLLIYYTNF